MVHLKLQSLSVVSCVMENSTCPSSNGSSIQICLENFELCCDNECLPINQTCPGFSNDEIWVGVVFALSVLTDIGQIFIAIWYHKVFFERLTWSDDNEGFLHQHCFKYIEQFTNWITCGYLGRKKFRGKEIQDIIDIDKVGLWFHMFLSLALAFLQRLLDLPYISMSIFKIFLGDGCNFISSRQLTKPLEFYLLFLLAEFYGLWAFWYCVRKLKEDMKKYGKNTNYISDDVRNLQNDKKFTEY